MTRCNVSKSCDWEATWSYVEGIFGGNIQILVNNAGVSPAMGWELCLNVNIYGLMNGSFLARDKMGKSKVNQIDYLGHRHYFADAIFVVQSASFYNLLKGGEGGRVINIASMAGLVPGVTGFDGLGYAVSKWGTVSITR